MREIINEIEQQKLKLITKLIDLGDYDFKDRFILHFEHNDNTSDWIVNCINDNMIYFRPAYDMYLDKGFCYINSLSLDTLILLADYFVKNDDVNNGTIPITFGLIKAKCGWSEFCDVTGGNHYAINEGWEPCDREIIDVKIKHAKELGLI